jgi:metal-responsive CopG/Arc/MetJ family transcriptional regulator
MAMSGKDISRYFTNKGEIRLPVKRVNVDFTIDMLKELDAVAKELNISRQAVIKTYLRQALNQHYLARQSPR